jgi:hypothetical protein
MPERPENLKHFLAIMILLYLIWEGSCLLELTSPANIVDVLF